MSRVRAVSLRATPARRGRPATASRDDVLRMGREQYLAGRRLDLTVIANQLGLGRATIYRWFGSREGLLGEVVAGELEQLVAFERRRVRRRGAEGLLEIFDAVNRRLARSAALRALLEQERDGALRMLTLSGGHVQPRAVSCVRGLIEREMATGSYVPPLDPAALAYAIVRLAEAFLYNDVAIGIRGDWRRLREVEAALLGLSTPASRAHRADRQSASPGPEGRSAAR